MYPGDFNIIGKGILGFAGAGLDAEAAADLAYSEGYTYWTDFLFQECLLQQPELSFQVQLLKE